MSALANFKGYVYKLFHEPLYIIRLNRNIFHEVYIAIFGNPYIIFNPDAYLFLFYIDAWLNREYHALFDGFGFCAKIMYINAKVV